MFNLRRKLSESGEIEVSDSIVHGGDHERRKIEEPIGLENLKKFLGVIFLAILVIILRTAYLQIVHGSYYLKKAEQNRISKLVIKAPRGLIVTADNETLVNNAAGFDAVIIPSLLPKDSAQKKKVLERCVGLIGETKPVEEISPQIENFDPYKLEPYLLKESLSRDEALSLELSLQECPGFITEKSAVRDYKDSLIFSHILGYTGRVSPQDLKSSTDYLMTDIIGKSGIEEYWEKELKGVHGSSYVEVDSSGRILRRLQENMPGLGHKLVLGIDKGLQTVLHQSMERVLSGLESNRGAAVAIDPRDGTIKALVSFPGFDNNLFSQKISVEDYNKLINDENKPLLNRAIAGRYPPGSTIKPLIGLAALEEGVVNGDTSVDCPGALYVGQWRFGDWKTHGHNIDLKKAIAESCDVYFYTVGGGYGDIRGLGIENIGKYARFFKLDKKTGIDLNGESSGFIPSAEWKKEAKGEDWYIGNTYHASIGQGDLGLTPLQVAEYISAIANGGTLYRPHLVTEVKDSQNDELIYKVEPEEIIKEVGSRNNIEIIKEGMRETIVSGTAQSLKEIPVPISGKTGTAQIGGTENTHSWFVGFAPYDNPSLVIAVLVEEGGESTDAAVPVAKEGFWYYYGTNKF